APELDNPNAFMAGVAGSGKSTTANFVLLNVLATGAQALGVDVGGSYRRIGQNFGGNYFDGASHRPSERGLNPFFPHEDLLEGDDDDQARRFQMLMSIVERMLVEHSRPELTNVERAVLRSAIAQTYEDVRERTPILSDLVAALRSLRAAD